MASDKPAKAARSRDDASRFKQQVYASTKLPFHEAAEFLRKKAKLTTHESKELWGAANDKAFTVAGLLNEAALQEVLKAVQGAIDSGGTLKEFEAQLKGILDRHGESLRGNLKRRARTIYLTNLRTARAAGRLQQMQRVAQTMPYWRYRHGMSANPRSDHLKLDGKVLRADDPLWQVIYPPNGWGCSCYVEPLSEAGLQAIGGLEKNKLKVERAPNGLPKGVQPEWAHMPGATAEPYSGEVLGSDKTFGGRRTLEAHAQKWAASLKPELKEAIADYTDFLKAAPDAATRSGRDGQSTPMAIYDELNSYRRGVYPEGQLTPARKERLELTSKKLEAALSSYVLPKDITVFRGVSLENAVACIQGIQGEFDFSKADNGFGNARRLREKARGKTFLDNGFVSTSISAAGAFEKEVVLAFRLKRGDKRGAFVKFSSETSEQDEFLLKPSEPFTVHSTRLEIRNGRAVVLITLK